MLLSSPLYSIGCGIPVLTGPVAPNLATAGSFALFTGNGSMANSGESTIVGDVGSHTAASTGIDIIDSGNAFTIYPNPFNVSLKIKLNDALKGNKYELVIYNVLGEVVMKTAITVGQITTIETGNIRSGVYFYKVMDNDITIRSGKMIKQK